MKNGTGEIDGTMIVIINVLAKFFNEKVIIWI